MAIIFVHFFVFVTVTTSVTSRPAEASLDNGDRGVGRQVNAWGPQDRYENNRDDLVTSTSATELSTNVDTIGNTHLTGVSDVTGVAKRGHVTNIMRTLKERIGADDQNYVNVADGRELTEDAIDDGGDILERTKELDQTVIMGTGVSMDTVADDSEQLPTPVNRQDTDCTLTICENILRENKSAVPGRKRPPPVPIKAQNWRQIEKSRHVIVKYNDRLSETVPSGVLPSLPTNQTIVELTGEEDFEVMQNFGAFFHNFEEVPPTDTNFRVSRGNAKSRQKRSGHVYVCAHEKNWEQIILAFSANNGLVQLYQTEELKQFVLTNRCVESRSSVVPDVICVNEISTVNVVVLNFETGLIEPTFINVETCRAKFVT